MFRILTLIILAFVGYSVGVASLAMMLPELLGTAGAITALVLLMILGAVLLLKAIVALTNREIAQFEQSLANR